MLSRNMFLRYQQEAGNDGAESGGATEAKSFTEADVQKMIADAVGKVSADFAKERDALLGKNNALIAERRKDQETVAREKARADGKLEDFEAAITARINQQYEPVVALNEALKSRVTSESKRAALGSFAADFNDPASLEIVSQLIKTEFDGSDVKTQYTDFAGNVITTDAAEFKKWMANHPAISHLMKADISSGGMDIGGKDAKGGAFVSQNATPLDRKRAELRNKLNSKFK